jgi:methionyl-tRNA formyltransferase
LKIVFAGTPQFAAIMLDAVMAAGHDVACVLTQPDRPAGRGRKIHPSPVKAAAERHGLTVLQPTALGDGSVSDILSAVRADVIVVAAYGLIVPRPLLGLPRLGCINVHASLLPRWRGAAPIQHALLAGDAVTGISIMQMDEGLDTGPILLQDSLPIAPDDTAGTLHDKLAGMGARLLVEALARRPQPRPQDAALATPAPKITRALAEIHWSAPATFIERQVRAFNPVPGAHTQWGGAELKLWRAQVECGSPGKAS